MSTANDCSVSFGPDHRAAIHDDEGQAIVSIQDAAECAALIDALLTIAGCFEEVRAGRYFANSLDLAVDRNTGSGSRLVRLYNQGYHAGHEDTVEGVYTDVFPRDMDTFHEDRVAEILRDGAGS